MQEPQALWTVAVRQKEFPPTREAMPTSLTVNALLVLSLEVLMGGHRLSGVKQFSTGEFQFVMKRVRAGACVVRSWAG